MLLRLGPVALAGVGLTAAVWFAAAVALGYAVFADASARGSAHAPFWGVVSVVSPLALVYLVARRRLDARGPPSDRERLARTVAGAVLLAAVVGSVLAPPDPFAQVLWFWPALLASVPVSYVVLYRT